ncbi:hypothetical protein Q8F55_004888 [Vanrija albida]|uniref:Uncharacterized protein n=1 Tax=Vanrija albida TaxID=181172 RepID=A0ABR3Q0C1_9TREE
MGFPTFVTCAGRTVRSLKSLDDWEAWNIGLIACLFPHKADRHFFTLEPYRETEYKHHITFYQPAGEKCGEEQPEGEQIAASFGMDQLGPLDLERQLWWDWAEKERLARSALLTTVDPVLLSKVEHTKLWSARDIYVAVGPALYGESSIFARVDALRRLQALRLEIGRPFEDLKIHFSKFEQLARQAHATDNIKVSIFLRSLLDPKVRARTEAVCSPRGRVDISWDAFIIAFKAFLAATAKDFEEKEDDEIMDEEGTEDDDDDDEKVEEEEL